MQTLFVRVIAPDMVVGLDLQKAHAVHRDSVECSGRFVVGRRISRRRAIQMAYNAEHGIVPKTIVKAIPDSIEISDKAENARMNTRRMGKLEREAAIDRLTREMKEAAKLLEFEHAAFLRQSSISAEERDRLRQLLDEMEV